MELRELRSLHALSETGSISQAARIMNLTPAAIHKQLKHLEDQLQVPLYAKGKKGLQLTPAAEILLPYLRDILGQQESALSALEEWKGMRRGLVRLGAGPSLATYLLPNLLRAYHEKHPQIDLDVQTGSSVQLLEGVQNGSLDLALLVASDSMEAPSVKVVAERLVEVPLVTAISQVPQRCSLLRLTNWPFLLFRRGSRIEAIMARYWSAQKQQPSAIMRFDSAEAMKTTLMTGVGVAMMPAYTVAKELKEGRLRRIRQRENPLMMKVHVLTRRTGYCPPAVNEMLELTTRML